MNDEPFANWRGWVAAGLLAIVAAIIVAAWPEPTAKVPAPIVEAPLTTRLVPPPLQALDRGTLIDAAGSAASSYAAGMSVDQKVAELAGRRFELILPFGCDGPTPPNNKELTNGWRYEAESGVLQVAFPSSVQGLAPRLAESGSSPEQTAKFSKSFWIEREWLRSANCPPSDQAQNEDIVAQEDPSLAIVELSVSEARRAENREGTPYRVSKRVPAEQAPSEQGLRIVITGRLATAIGLPIRCKSFHRNKRPVCVIVARFDVITVTDATGDITYVEWRS